jgi:protein phosphatase
VEPELTVDHPQVNDLYLACSDGLSEMVEDWILQNILIGQQDHLEDCAQALVRAANQNGGNDNITVVLVRFLAG